jgi:aspartyl-tRNA(Asn)/glutamyl-tRNA(Gln) amidotransferase subunit A
VDQLLPSSDVRTEDLSYSEIATLAPLLARREVSPVEVARACLDRIAAHDGSINAFITVLEESALREAEQAEREIGAGNYRGPLHGIPIAHKDLYDTRGIRTTAGSKILSDFVPDQDATAVDQLRAAGSVLLGKLNMHEFAAGGTNENPHYGAAHNPWDVQRIPGGSSGGSAAALASGMCLGATGSDTAGSIRIPSHYCGTSGIKPTYGRVSAYGVVPLSWSLDHCGPMTRSARDAALMLQAMAGYDPRDPASIDQPVPDFSAELEFGVRGLRVGLPTTHFNEHLEPDVERAWRAAIDVLVEQGAKPVDVAFEAVRQADTIGPIILRNDMFAFHAEWFAERPDDYGPATRARLDSVQNQPAIDYIRAQRARNDIRAEFRQAFERVDVLITPTMPATAPLIGAEFPTVSTRFTYPFNLTGLPVLEIPCGFDSQGLPIGMQIAADAWQEARAFQVGHAYQRATDWHRRRPRIAG